MQIEEKKEIKEEKNLTAVCCPRSGLSRRQGETLIKIGVSALNFFFLSLVLQLYLKLKDKKHKFYNFSSIKVCGAAAASAAVSCTDTSAVAADHRCGSVLLSLFLL